MKNLKHIVILSLLLCSIIYSQSVLILEDNRTEDSVLTILTNAGINVVLGGNYWEYSGEEINQYEVVIFLNGYTWGETVEESVQQKIRNYVFDGGNLLTTEWLTYHYSSYPTINEILPALYNYDYGYEEETYYKMIDHPISKSLPDSFIVPVDWSYSHTIRDTAASKNTLTIFTGSFSGDAVVLGHYGSGKIVHWNMAGQYSNDDIWTEPIKVLLINIIQYLVNAVHVERGITIPENFLLDQNYPNPFNPITRVQYAIANNQFVTLKVYDVLGKEVETLVNEEKPVGTYELNWNAANLPSGVYFYRFQAGSFVETKKMILLK